jgi:hypothetical protein
LVDTKTEGILMQDNHYRSPSPGAEVYALAILVAGMLMAGATLMVLAMLLWGFL